MKPNLSKVRTELEDIASNTNFTELQLLEKLKNHYFNKKVTENLKLYKKGKKKVREITKDLKISHRKFYTILDKKNISYTKYNKTNKEQD